jgi:hypothetical protein
MKTIEDVLNRLRTEYVAMPGLQLKPTQVQRLCGIDKITCQVLLDILVDTKFLCVKPDGHYARLTGSHRVRPAKAELRNDVRAKHAS